jgi:inner membrane protein
LLLLVVSTLRLRQPRLAWLTLAWALAYPGLGWVQRERATATGWELAASRGHEPLQLEAKPSFANLLVWKVVYETDERYYVDAVRAGRRLRVYHGDSVKKLDIERDFPWLDHQSQQARDVERFRWFSNGYIAQDPANPARLIDIRYSMLPNEIDALWGIELSTAARDYEHAAYVVQREGSRERGQALLRMIFD